MQYKLHYKYMVIIETNGGNGLSTERRGRFVTTALSC
jgi:hypothetical protein